MSGAAVIITGLGLEIPGIQDTANLLDALKAPVEASEFIPADKLGRQGLRYKDRATKLALCAAQTALTNAGLPTSAATQITPETFGVVVSSNLGNVDTVCRVLDTIYSEGADSVSPLDMPNLSSNVIASSLAIRFGCKALNLMVCNGATSGIDATHLAANAIRARRADRVLVVGVEPVNPLVERLMEEAATTWLGFQSKPRLGEGSAAIVLESAGSVSARDVKGYARLGRYAYSYSGDVARTIHEVDDEGAAPPDLWLTPNLSYNPAAEAAERRLTLWNGIPPVYLDLSYALGETYGALGVIQCVAACLWLLKHCRHKAVATSGACWDEGVASLIIESLTHS